MKHSQKKLFKILSFVSGTLLIVQSLLPGFIAIQQLNADEEPTPTTEQSAPAQEPTVAPTEEPKPTEAPQTTLTPDPTPTEEPTPTPTIIDSALTPTLTETPAPTSEPSATPAPEEVQPSPEPSTNVNETGPPSSNPTPEASPTPSLSPAPTPTPETVEKICSTEVTKETITFDWDIDSGREMAQTREKVTLDTKYVYPYDSGVSVTFTCLPKDESLRSNLKIERVKISDLKLPEGVTPDGEYAYDITTGMENGTFEYSVTLPKAEGKSADVSYIEKSLTEAQNTQLTTDDIKPVEDSKINQEGNTVKVTNLDHFTIFIVYMYDDNGNVVVDPTQPDSNHKIDICHKNSGVNSYTKNIVDDDSVIKPTGHDSHSGDIIPKFDYKLWEKVGTHLVCPSGYSDYGDPDHCRKWHSGHWVYADKIEADKYDWVVYTYPGKNFDPSHQAILDNDCKSTGSISIKKITNPHDDWTDFEFQGDLGEFSLKNGETKTKSDKQPGSYTITEDAKPGWGLTDITCTGTDAANITKNISSGFVTINLQTAKHVTCTFTNAKFGSISGYKFNDQNGDGIRNKEQHCSWEWFHWHCEDEYTEPTLSGWTITLNQNGTLIDSTTTDSNGNYSFSHVIPSTYEVCEVQQSGWISTHPTGSLCQTVTVNPDKCHSDIYFGNKEQPHGTITIDKVTSPAGDTTDFSFNLTSTDTGVDQNFTLKDQDSPFTNEFQTGVYTIEEKSIPAEWNLNNLVCDQPATIDLNTHKAIFDLDANEHITCTYTNTFTPPCPNLFISEYIEGTSYNKALEIYNPTGSSIDLAAGGYKVQMYFNGNSSAGLTINLTGTVASGDVYVLANHNANATILAQADQIDSGPTGWYNGNDAVVLTKGTAIVDAIGRIGQDPGSEWGTGLTSTKDNTLVRKCGQTCGDKDPYDAFDPSVQWTGYATDTISYLGSHQPACNGSITGIKFEDKNGNHVQDADENGLPGWTIYIDSNKNNQKDPGEPTQITDSNGNFTFSNVSPGNYWVKEVNQTGWSQTRPTYPYQEVDLTSGENEFIYFGNKRTTVTIKAYKIVCDSEADLPNWGGTDGSGINASTAQNYVETHPNCHLESRWDFQWGFQDKESVAGVDKLTGNHIGPADGTPSTCSDNCGSNTQTGGNYNNWKNFDSSTDTNGIAQVLIDNIESAPGIWVRENLKSGYVPFTYPPKGGTEDNVSAEIYCHNDAYKYDNYDRIESPTYGHTYYCVAFNAPLSAPKLEISKVNDATGDKNPGESVVYTITVKALDSAAFNVHMTDLLPAGFVYRPGSWGAKKNSIAVALPEPTYASPGTWDLGNMAQNDVYELTLTADISTSQNPGTYKDLALAYGCSQIEGDCGVGGTDRVIAQAVDPGKVVDTFVGTQVTVIKEEKSSASVNIIREETQQKTETNEQVLGASTTLPATGVDTKWIAVATLLLTSGIGFVIIGKRMIRRYHA